MSAQLLMKVGEGRGHNIALGQLRPVNGVETNASEHGLMQSARWWTRAADGLLASFEELWAACCKEVVGGQTAEVHALRADILEIMQTRMALLEEGLNVVRAIQNQSGVELPEEASLHRTLARLDRMKQEILGRWQTPEDLEDLVAEQMAPTEEEFQAVADRYGPLKTGPHCSSGSRTTASPTPSHRANPRWM